MKLKDPVRYAELSTLTNFSFLRGASHAEELIQRAVDLGLHSLAITDLNGVYALPRSYGALKRMKQSNSLKLICGAKITLEDYPAVTLLVRNRDAYGLLCRMITAAHADRPRGEPALEWTLFLEFLERPQAKGLILIPDLTEKTPWLELSKHTQKDQLYIPVSRFFDGFDEERIELAKKVQNQFNLPLVARNEVHLHTPERRKLQDTLTAIRQLTPLEQLGRNAFSNSEHHLKSPQEMSVLFSDLPEALENTVKIAESCHFSMSELRYYYPSEWIPKGETAQSFLEKLTWEGVKERYPRGASNEVLEQIRYELKLIRELQFSDYFLTIWDIVRFARSQDILCQGRGSAANSVVCYCLGITAVDPIHLNLLFERFISAERNEPPDIDVDFEHERREEVIQYIYQKYGRDRAGMVSAVVTYRKKSAIREVVKAFGFDPDQREARERALQNPIISKMTEEIKSFPRHLSIHSGGFTLSAHPIIETVPIEPARMPGRTIVQWDKHDLEEIGLLKVDILALGMLSAIQKTFKMISGLSLEKVPHNDQRTYSMIQKADTVGVFQIESRAQMNMLGRLLPRNFYDLVIQVAIVRPGPITGQMVHPYLKRRRGQEPVIYHHPKLESILGKTLGVPIFQEQVMKMSVELAGFTAGESDQLRRAIGAWRSSGSINEIGKRLMKGLLKSGLPEDFVQRIFQQIQGFSEYGFPESHAASFALLAYVSSYLKANYPAEFTCALINSQPLGFYSNQSLVHDARRHGVEVRPVHPNHSHWDCQVRNGELQLGFRITQGINKNDVTNLIQERKQQPFQSLTDFMARTQFNKNVLQTLAIGDAFNSFGLSQRQALWQILAYEVSYRTLKNESQLNLFSHSVSQADHSFPELNLYESIQADYSSFRLTTRGHPMGALRLQGIKMPRPTSKDVRQCRHGQIIRVAGLVITRQRPQTAKGTVFATMEDEHGFLDLILHKKTFAKYKELFVDHRFIIVSGVVQRDTHSVSILVRYLKPLFPHPKDQKARLAQQSRDFR